MLSCALAQLAELAQNWPKFCAELNLASNTTRYEFWNSLWDTMVESVASASESETIRLLRTMLCGDGLGMRRLMKDEEVIPTRLTGVFERLVNLSQIKYVASGILQEDDILKAFSELPGFQRQIGKGHLVHRDVEQALNKMLDDPPHIDSLSPMQIVQWEIERKVQIDPLTAQRLGALITSEFMTRRLVKHNAQLEELRSLLGKLEFQNSHGNYLPVRDLLTASHDSNADSVESDEFLRGRFCPFAIKAQRRLWTQAVAFFRICRERLSAPVETMVKWAFEADDNQRRRAVLDYCLRGSLRSELVRALHEDTQFSHSWFHQLDQTHPLLGSIRSLCTWLFLSQLGLLRTAEMPEVAKPLPQLQIGPTLQRIYDWWHEEGEMYRSEYEGRTYPTDQPPTKTVLAATDNQNEAWRHAWLTLFVLGSSHTFGRVRSETHRNFLRRCQERGWFGIFADPCSNADAWLNVLDEYLDDDQIGAQDLQYWQLVGKQFVSIYQMSRHLSEYVELFMYIDRAKTVVELDDILNVRKSPLFQGSGLDAPPIKRTLGLGACFVIRELARLNVIQSPHAHRHCYVPVQRVRDRFVELGCKLDEKPGIEQSSQIYRFLCEHLDEQKATFDMSFDIPFQIMHAKWHGIPSHLCVYE